jgi:acyl-CoA synthetase (AMP-forming)/AMP-acid ligase II
VRGAIVTQGYFQNPEATRSSFRNGWFATGDIAIEKDGKFFIIDRLKELIKYKGNQVAPAELEGLLITHPLILEAAVVGVPEDASEAAAANGGVASSEVPRAYVVRRPGVEEKISADEVRRFIAERLAPYKQIRGGVVFVDELPRGTLGKILRKDLRVRAAGEVQREMKSKL